MKNCLRRRIVTLQTANIYHTQEGGGGRPNHITYRPKIARTPLRVTFNQDVNKTEDGRV